MSMRHPKQARFQWFLLCQYLQTIFCWSRECRVKIWPVCWNKTLELSLSHRSQILHFHFLPSHKSAELTTMTASKVLSSKALKFPPIIRKSRAHIVTLFSPVRLRNFKFCSSFSPPKWKVTQGFLLRSESTQKRGSRDGHACLRLEKTMIRWRGKSSLLKDYLDQIKAVNCYFF